MFSATLTDQRGVVHAYTYNARRQLARDGATTLPGGVDGAVKSLVYDYDSLGRVWGFYSRANADGTGTVHNSVRLTYEAQGYLQYLWQSHEGAGAGSEPKTWHQYDSSHTSNILHNAGRLAILNYPNGATVQFRHGYNTGGMFQNPDNIADRLDQTTMLKFTPSGGSLTDLVAYQYNGVDRPVETDYVGPDVRKQSFNLGGAGANDYNAFDRFGGTVSHRWYDYTGGSALRDQFDYTYDYAGNRLSRDIPETALYATDNRDQVYAYDGLLRLATFDEGTQSGGSISGTPAREEDWTLDGLGNWSAFVQKAAGSTTLDQPRTHNKANELSTIGATVGTNWTDVVQDAAGNMTTIPQPAAPASGFTLVWDAWNRLAAVKNGANFVQKLEYDALHRRIVKEKYVAGVLNETRHYYYNDQWQVIEERVGANGDTAPVDAQYVWHPEYVDALAARYWDSGGAASPDAYHYYLQDANANVTAVADSTGAVVERYGYTPYGAPTVLDASFAVDADGISDVENVYLYTGREYDAETGLQLNGHRYYASHLGRWLRRDPIEYAPGDANLYAYVGAMPTYYVDPSGLAPLPGDILDYDDPCLMDPNCGRPNPTDILDPLPPPNLLEPPSPLPPGAVRDPKYCHNYPCLVCPFPNPDFCYTIDEPPRQIDLSEPDTWELAIVGFPAILWGPQFSACAATTSSNPFLGRTPKQIDRMFRKKGFEPKGPDPIVGRGSYINPKTDRKYYIDPGGKYKKGIEPPHIDVHRPPTSKLPKKKFPLLHDFVE